MERKALCRAGLRWCLVQTAVQAHNGTHRSRKFDAPATRVQYFNSEKAYERMTTIGRIRIMTGADGNCPIPCPAAATDSIAQLVM